MVSLSSSATFAILASLVAAQNPIVASLANQIVDGIAAAKTDDSVSPEQATSELQAVLKVVTKNPDMIGLFSKAMPVAMAGLNENNLPELLSAAGQSLAAFEGSPDYAQVSDALHSALPHYDVPRAMANVENNLARVMAIVTPSLPSLTPLIPEQWSRATMRVQALAQDLGLAGGAPSFAIEDENAPTATGDAPEPTGDSESNEDDQDDSNTDSNDDSTVEDDSNVEDDSQDDSTVEDDSQDDSTVEDDSQDDSTVEDDSNEDDSTSDDSEISDDTVTDTTDKQVVDSEDDSSTDANSTIPSIPNGNGIDQANSASSFNAQLAAGAAVVAAFAALI
ncbi:hypothetical protein CKK34_5055 [Yarrowia sp. E02]|nr:hypothetical protein CKK34_5055 [Yarrowia sp. E02]